ncbi:cytochrome c oxidase subunit II [Tianweitania sediminis]|uniref:Cytochrome c oxidase subunit 2 n=1 Tax=Tianweitania sediminis TaxID=1502156 RepID=A0A8J7UJM3_9HYPH|nr:cytochrome c oxidase subunit II [Tianweitania sediminis]MBP0438794.1 cytochrome c oxidase subunit II [Tianweitania sediminis]
MKKLTGVAGAMVLLSSAAAWAQAPGQPTPWQFDFQVAASPIMESIAWFEDYTLWFITPITLLVLALLAWCVLRFRESANPTPSRTSHNTLIEVIWTVGPVLVLLCIAIPSFQLLTAQYSPPEEPAITLKATGNQWNWDYEYQLEQPISFNSAILTDAARPDSGKEDLRDYPRLLAVDNEVVLPVSTTIRLLTTGSDVIHAFAVPAFGVKLDAVPGRINEMWFRAEREGLYYGQCSENCGKDHAFMPIAIRIVNQAQYDAWVAAAATDVGGANRALMASIEAQNKIASAGE